MCSVFSVVEKTENQDPDQLREIKVRSTRSELMLDPEDEGELKPRSAPSDASQKTPQQLTREASIRPAAGAPTVDEKPSAKRTSVGATDCFIDVSSTYAPPVRRCLTSQNS